MSEAYELSAEGRFPRSARVRARREYARIHKTGVRVRREAFTVIIADNTAGRARLGMAVSRKVGSAVQRNRLRRCLRELFRRLQRALPAVDVVVIAEPKATELGREGPAAIAAVLLPQLAEGLARRGRRPPKGTAK